MPHPLAPLRRLLAWWRPTRKRTTLADMQQARQHMLDCVGDCNDSSALRLRARIHRAANHRDLWMLRSEAYRVISLSHCQSVAVERIDQLMHLFDQQVSWSDSGRPS